MTDVVKWYWGYMYYVYEYNIIIMDDPIRTLLLSLLLLLLLDMHEVSYLNESLREKEELL